MNNLKLECGCEVRPQTIILCAKDMVRYNLALDHGRRVDRFPPEIAQHLRGFR